VRGAETPGSNARASPDSPTESRGRPGPERAAKPCPGVFAPWVMHRQAWPRPRRDRTRRCQAVTNPFRVPGVFCIRDPGLYCGAASRSSESASLGPCRDPGWITQPQVPLPLHPHPGISLWYRPRRGYLGTRRHLHHTFLQGAVSRLSVAHRPIGIAPPADNHSGRPARVTHAFDAVEVREQFFREPVRRMPAQGAHRAMPVAAKPHAILHEGER
jgi:hypothetical protein